MPMKRLYILQLVNKTWRDVIHRSEKLRKKIFIVPNGRVVRPVDHWFPAGITYLDTCDSGQLQINPGVGIDYINHGIPELIAGIPGTECLTFATENQFAAMIFSTYGPQDGSFETRLGLLSDIPPYDTQPASSWFSMLLTQPPVVASTGCYWDRMAGEDERSRTQYTRYNPAGSRLRDLVSDQRLEHGGEACLRLQYSYIDIRWTDRTRKEILAGWSVGAYCGLNKRYRRKIKTGCVRDKDERCLCTALLKEQEWNEKEDEPTTKEGNGDLTATFTLLTAMSTGAA